jgi:hypothetical protein
MPTLYNNNAFSTLAAAITSSGQTSVTVQTGHGDRFPLIVSPDVAFITLENTAGTREVIKITARAATSDVLTVTRGEEGTSATTWAIGDLIEQRITAGELTDFRTRPGFTTTATSAGTLTLTKGSTEIQTLTGSTTHTVVLPVVSTLYTGKSFTINNNSTGIVTVNSSGSNAVVAIQPGNSADIICVLITGTTAASWTVMTAFGASNGALPGTLSVGGTATMAAINASGTVAMAGAATVGTTLGVTGLSTLGTDGLLSLTTKGYFNSKYNAAASLWQWGPGAISTANAFGFTVGGTNVLDLLSGGIAVTGTLGVTGTSTMAAINASGNINSTTGISLGVAQNTLTNFSATNASGGTGARAGYGCFVDAGQVIYQATGSAYAEITGAADAAMVAIDNLSGGFQVCIAGAAADLKVVAGAVTIPGTLGVTGATTIGAASAGVGTLTINHATQPTIYLAKTNATATTWQIYNNGNLGITDGTNYPVYFVGANSVFGGSMDVVSATGGQYLLVGATQSGASKSAYMQLYGTDSGSATKRWYVGINPFRTDGSYEVVTSAGTGVYIVPAATAWTATSDERLKDIIEPITDAVSKVSTLRAVIGKFKTDSEETRRSFLIAQDVQAVFPEAVEASDPDKLGVQYTDMIPLLVAAIKELAADFQAYKSSHP